MKLRRFIPAPLCIFPERKNSLSIVNFKYRIGRITAAQFLHGPLDAVPGISPVLVLVHVILLVAEPGDFLLEPFHILFHQVKQNGIKFFFLLVVQLFFATSTRSRKWGRQNPLLFLNSSANSLLFLYI